MNELSKYLVEQILLEDDNPIQKIVVIYVGRFQPFHKGHYATYQHLVKKFGKDNVFIGTSNKVENPKSPFNFKEKVKIMNTMFGIPTSKIHQVKNPYKPTEILEKFDESKTAFVTVVGEKDKNRLGGQYFTPLKGKIDEPYRDRGYVYSSPSQPNPISGTDVRNGLSLGSDDQKEQFFTQRAYGKFNKTIFKMITDKLNEGIHIPKEVIEEWLIKESSRTATGQVDDGPNFFFPNYDTFTRVNIKRAAKIGYDVVNMIMSKDIEDYYEHPNYPDGPVKSVSYFPAGVIGKTTATNQVDIYSSKAYSDWYKHITRKAALAGYELVQTALSKSDTKDDMKQSGADAKDIKKLQSEFDKSITEAITIPVEIGDTVLMGKFKNKKVVVKSIGKDEHGMPTINGKKVATFRLVQEGKEVIFEEENEGSANTIAGTAVRCEKCNHSWEIEVNDIHPYLCHSCGWDSQQQEYDFDEFDSWREKMGLIEALTPAQRARRQWLLAPQASTIKRKRQRTMIRKKSHDKLKKIALKMAWRDVYEFFRKRLYPNVPKEELTVIQKKQIEKWVAKKKRKVLKRARWKYWPMLRDREAQKFKSKEDNVFEQLAKGMSLKDIADKHRVSLEELSKEAKKGVKVEMEHTSDVKVAYDIAKDHLFEDPKYYTKLATIEELAPHGYPDQEWMDTHEREMKKLRTQLDKQQKEIYK